MAITTSIKLNVDGYDNEDVILKVSLSSRGDISLESSDHNFNNDSDSYNEVVSWTKGELLELVGTTDEDDFPGRQWQRHASSEHIKICVVPQYNANPNGRNNDNERNNNKLGYVELLALAVPTALLVGAIGSWFFVRTATGYDAVFPSCATTGIAFKITIWITLSSIVFHEHFYYWTNTTTPTTSTSTSTTTANNRNKTRRLTVHLSSTASASAGGAWANVTDMRSHNPHSSTNDNALPVSSSQESITSSTAKMSSHNNTAATAQSLASSLLNTTIPFRFIRAEKGDIKSAKSRWQTTLQWRQDMGMDTILQQPHPKLTIIKQNYPHCFHLRGKNNEPCYYETPPKINLKAMREAGISMDDLLRHYALCCEFMWTVIEPSEDGKSIYVINLEGMGMRDFAGEVVDFVKRASAFTSAHYPERSGTIFIINVPSWFSIIWNAVKGLVDDVTKQKIKIIKQSSNPERIKNALLEKIDIQNIPPEYGGQSVPLGQSHEELLFQRYFDRLNNTDTTIHNVVTPTDTDDSRKTSTTTTSDLTNTVSVSHQY